MTTSNGAARRAEINQQLSRPSPDCLACAGSGFYDVPLADTAEVRTVLCRMTDGCRRHADRAQAWAAQEGLVALIDFVKSPTKETADA